MNLRALSLSSSLGHVSDLVIYLPLSRDLRRRGFDMHTLPLYQLQRLVARLALKSEVCLELMIQHDWLCLMARMCHC